MAKKSHLLKATASVTLVIMLSKALGFVRDMITAGYFGTGMESDAYASAYSLFYVPILLFNSCITSTLVPMCMKARQAGGLEEENRFASRALNAFCLIALVLTAVMLAFAEPLVNLVYYAFDGEKAALTASLTRVMLITMVFHIASIALSSILNAREKYMAAQITGFALSVCVIAATVFFSGRYGVMATAWGVAVASVLEALILVPFLKKDFKYDPSLPFRDGRVRELLVLGFPAMFSMAISEFNHMIDRFLASGLGTGAIASMNYGYKLITFLLGVLLVPLTTIAFSKMSRRVAEKDTDGMLQLMRRCVELILIVILPIVVIGAVMAEDVVKLAYMRGNFGAESVALTAGVLLFYIVGVPGFGMRDMLNRVFHAVGDTKTPFRAACVTVAVNIVLNLILKDIMGVNGLALATSIAGTVGTALLFLMIRKRFGHLGMKKTAVRALLMLGSALAGGAAAYVVGCFMPASSGPAFAFVRLIASTAAGGVVYAGLIVLFRLHRALLRRG